MRKYILKRLGLIFITLLGISIITFAITRIAPGDPATLKLQAAMTSPKSQPITETMIEENRKLYGFDKPLFLNFQEKGRSAFIKDLLKQYTTQEDPYYQERFFADLKTLNMLALPFIFDILTDSKDLDEGRKDKLFNLARESLELNSQNKTYTLSDLKDYYQKIAPNLSPLVIRKNIEELASQGRAFRKSDLQFAKAAAVPFLIEAILSNSYPGKENELIELLSSLTSKPWKYDAKEKDSLYYFINRFWEYEKERYVDFSWSERAARVFSDTQFGLWLSKIINFDFDVSYAYKKPVLELIKERLPITIQLNILSILIIYLLALYLGIYSSTVHNSRKEKFLTLLLFVLYSLPSFWIANLLIMFFTGGDALLLNLFPTQGLHSLDSDTFGWFKYFFDWLWHLILPVLTLTYGGLAYLSRQMKVSMLEALNQDYVRTARAKGLKEKTVIYKHALRNALIPIITLLGGLLPSMLGGSIIVEEIFTINGMGKLSFEAIMNRDYPVINAIAFISAFLTLIGILISDLLYVVADPRIRLDKVDL